MIFVKDLNFSNNLCFEFALNCNEYDRHSFISFFSNDGKTTKLSELKKPYFEYNLLFYTHKFDYASHDVYCFDREIPYFLYYLYLETNDVEIKYSENCEKYLDFLKNEECKDLNYTYIKIENENLNIDEFKQCFDVFNDNVFDSFKLGFDNFLNSIDKV